jgi:hypothetical protein
MIRKEEGGPFGASFFMLDGGFAPRGEVLFPRGKSTQKRA